MPTYNSVNGIWSPAKERTFDKKKDDMYEGPDRAATDVLAEQGLDHLGMDVTKDPENITRARQLGVSVEEFLMLDKEDSPEQKKAKEEKLNKVVTHKRGRPRKKAVQPQGGGVTMSGGFGDTPSA